MNELNELDSIYSADPNLLADPSNAQKRKMLTQRILAALAQQYKTQQGQTPTNPQQQSPTSPANLFSAGQNIGGLFSRLF